jgi:hypothetical protein
MFFLLLGFAAFRIEIGILRVYYNTTENAQIAQAHAYAFLWWGVADLTVLTLLIFFTLEYVRDGERLTQMLT